MTFLIDINIITMTSPPRQPGDLSNMISVSIKVAFMFTNFLDVYMPSISRLGQLAGGALESENCHQLSLL